MVTLNVFLTRPRGRNGKVPERLRALGMVVHELPALELRPLAPVAPLPTPDAYDAVVFVSRYAVERYLELLAAEAGGLPRWPAGVVAATVGAASARPLLASGVVPAASVVHPPADAPSQDSEALLAVLTQRGVPLRRVLIVRGTHGREWLGRTLQARGVHVDFLPVYERVQAAWRPATTETLAGALARPEHCIFLLTSSEGVQALAARLSDQGLLAAWARAGFVVIHERIGATLQSVLSQPDDAAVRRLEHCMPDDASIVDAIRAAAGFAA